MRLFGSSMRQRVVVKTYGRDALVVWLNPLNAAFTALSGRRVGLRSDAEVLDRMQKDALAMGERGYRVVASDEYDLPLLFLPGRKTSYYRVTYELADPAAADRS